MNTRNDFVRGVWRFLDAVTEPALRPIRSFLPNLGGVDVSPIILILLIVLRADAGSPTTWCRLPSEPEAVLPPDRAPWRALAGGLEMRVRVTPRGGRDALDGIETRADGRPVLKLRVRAAPEGGAANAAAAALLARALGRPASSVTLAAGADGAAEDVSRRRRSRSPRGGLVPLAHAHGDGMNDGRAAPAGATSSTARPSPAGLRGRIAEAVARCRRSGVTPGLAVVLVGEDPASQIYVRNKAAQTVEAGMRSFDHALPAATPEAELLALVARLNADPAVDGILVQLPLPPQIDAAEGDRGDRSGEGRRRLPPGQCRPPPDRRAGLRLLHAARLPAARPVRAARPCRPRRGGDRALEHRRQADGAAAASRELHGDHGAFEDAATCPESAGAPTSSSPPSAGPRWCAATGSSPAPSSIDVGINRVPNPAAGEGKTRIVGDVAFAEAREVAGASRRCPAASAR